jgi:hypothetical protein
MPDPGMCDTAGGMTHEIQTEENKSFNERSPCVNNHAFIPNITRNNESTQPTTMRFEE